MGNCQGRDWNFQGRLKLSVEIEIFNPGLKLSSVWIENFTRSIGIEFFQSQGTLGIATDIRIDWDCTIRIASPQNPFEALWCLYLFLFFFFFSRLFSNRAIRFASDSKIRIIVHFVREFVSPRRQTPEVWNFCVLTVPPPPPLTLRQEKQYLYFGHLFPCTPGPPPPVLQPFLWRIPTEQVLYYKNLGLYYGLASGTLLCSPGPALGLRVWFWGRGWGQQHFSFQSAAVQWMARAPSLNCLSCRNPYQTPHSLNCLPPSRWKKLFLTQECFVASPSQKVSSYSVRTKLRAVLSLNQLLWPVCLLLLWWQPVHQPLQRPPPSLLPRLAADICILNYHPNEYKH